MILVLHVGITFIGLYYVEPLLNPWYESNLIMENDLLNVFFGFSLLKSIYLKGRKRELFLSLTGTSKARPGRSQEPLLDLSGRDRVIFCCFLRRIIRELDC